MKLGLNVTLIVFEDDSAPVDDAVSPIVQVEVAFAAVDAAEKLELVGADADAASAEKVTIRPPSAARPAIVPTSLLERDRPRAVDRCVARESRVIEFPFDKPWSRFQYPRTLSTIADQMRRVLGQFERPRDSGCGAGYRYRESYVALRGSMGGKPRQTLALEGSIEC
jgi:hypothetical protein